MLARTVSALSRFLRLIAAVLGNLAKISTSIVSACVKFHVENFVQV